MKDKEKLNQRRDGNREAILKAAAALIKRDGIGTVTVRGVCREAGISLGSFYYYFHDKDDLLMGFIEDDSFDEMELQSPKGDIAGRIMELYRKLFDRYLAYGRTFMCQFFHPENRALQRYMSINEEVFAPGSIKSRCEKELAEAKPEMDAHTASADLCTISMGLLFEYCLCDKPPDLYGSMERMVRIYLRREK